MTIEKAIIELAQARADRKAAEKREAAAKKRVVSYMEKRNLDTLAMGDVEVVRSVSEVWKVDGPKALDRLGMAVLRDAVKVSPPKFREAIARANTPSEALEGLVEISVQERILVREAKL